MCNKFKVFLIEDRGNTEREIDSYDASGAAEIYVAQKEAWDSEYPVGWGKDTVLIGVELSSCVVEMFRVSGQPVPEYHATIVRDIDEE